MARSIHDDLDLRSNQIINLAAGTASHHAINLGQLSAAIGSHTHAISDITGLQTALDGKQPLDADLTSLAALSTTGMVARTAANTFATRELTGTANQVLIANGTGAGGNPTFSLPQSIGTASNVQFGGIGIGVAGVAGALRLNTAAQSQGDGAGTLFTPQNVFGVASESAAHGLQVAAIGGTKNPRMSLFVDPINDRYGLSATYSTGAWRMQLRNALATAELSTGGQWSLSGVGANTGLLLTDFALQRHATDAGVGEIPTGNLLQLSQLTGARLLRLDSNKRIANATFDVDDIARLSTPNVFNYTGADSQTPITVLRTASYSGSDPLVVVGIDSQHAFSSTNSHNLSRVGYRARMSGAVLSGHDDSGYFAGYYADSRIAASAHQGSLANTFGAWTELGFAGLAGGGSVGAMYGFRSTLHRSAAGSSNNYYGLFLSEIGSTATVTARWGLFENLAAGAANYLANPLKLESLTPNRPVWANSDRRLETPTTAQFLTDIGAQPLDADLTSLAALSTVGMVARTATDTFQTREIIGTANRITVTNGTGAGGNPTLTTPQDIHTGASPTFADLNLTNTIGIPRGDLENLAPHLSRIVGSGWSYTAGVGPAGAGYLSKISGGSVLPLSGISDLIPVGPGEAFNFSYVQGLGNSTGNVRLALRPYDRLGNIISPQHVYCPTNTLTTLAVDLNPGDPTITLVSAANWPTTPGTSRLIGFNPVGHADYGIHGGYTRLVGNSANHASTPSTVTGDYTGIVGNELTLASAWAGPAYPAGTPVGNYRFSSSAIYADAVATPGAAWEYVRGSIRPMPSDGKLGTDISGRMWPGAVGFIVGILADSLSAFSIANLQLTRFWGIRPGTALRPSFFVDVPDATAHNTGWWWDTANARLAYSHSGTNTLAFGTNAGAALQIIAGSLQLDPLTPSRPVWLDANRRAITPTTAQFLTDIGAQPLDADLTSLAALSTVGMVARTASNTFATRELTGTANQVLIANGTGAGGNPTFSLPQSIGTASNVQFGSIGIGVAPEGVTGRISAAYNGTGAFYGGNLPGGGGSLDVARFTSTGATGMVLASDTGNQMRATWFADGTQELTGWVMRRSSSEGAFWWGDHSVGETMRLSRRGKLTLAISGSTDGGLQIVDALWYRAAADVMATPDALQFDALTPNRHLWLDGNRRVATKTSAEILTDIGAQPLDADLTSLAALSSTGWVVRTASDTFAVRTLEAGSGIAITNPTGAGGNPIISLSSPSVAWGDITSKPTTFDGYGITGTNRYSKSALVWQFRAAQIVPGLSVRWLRVPYNPSDGSSMTFDVEEFHAEVYSTVDSAAGSTVVKLQKASDPNGSFSDLTNSTLTLTGTGGFEFIEAESETISTTVASGDRLAVYIVSSTDNDTLGYGSEHFELNCHVMLRATA